MAAVRHPIFARFFDRFSQGMEQEVGPYRDEMLAGLSGRVLEIQVKSEAARSKWVWGAFKMPANVFAELHQLWNLSYPT